MFVFAIILILISISKLFILSFSKDLEKAIELSDPKGMSKTKMKEVLTFIIGLDGLIGLICGIFILVIIW